MAATYQIAVFQLQKLIDALVLVYGVIVDNDTLAVHGSLCETCESYDHELSGVQYLGGALRSGGRKFLDWPRSSWHGEVGTNEGVTWGA